MRVTSSATSLSVTIGQTEHSFYLVPKNGSFYQAVDTRIPFFIRPIFDRLNHHSYVTHKSKDLVAFFARPLCEGPEWLRVSQALAFAFYGYQGGVVGLAMGVLGTSFFYSDTRRQFYPINGSTLQNIKIGIFTTPPLLIVSGLVQTTAWYYLRQAGAVFQPQAIAEAISHSREPLFSPLFALTIVIFPLAEEILFRGYLRDWLMGESSPSLLQRIKVLLLPQQSDGALRIKTLFLTSLSFSLIHCEPSPNLSNVAVVTGIIAKGIGFGLLREGTGDLWASTTSHLVHNAILSALARRY